MDDGRVDVLVVADAGDPQADTVIKHLRSRDAEVIRWNLGDLRSIRQIVRPGALALWIDGAWKQVTNKTTVWWHRAGAVKISGLDEEEARLVAEEGPALLRGALMAAGVRWIDDPFNVDRAESRWAQLIAAWGILAPATVQTNYLDGASELTSAGPVVAKPVSPGRGIAPYVEGLTDDELAKLEGNPTFLQQLVGATADFRVVTVAGQSWVWRRERCSGVVDWRREDPNGTGFLLSEDPGVGADSIDIVARLGLTMGVLDWLETSSGPVFLEVNPQGGFLFLSEAEELVVPALAQHLLVPVVSTSAVEDDGTWPCAIRRVLWDLGRKSKAPANDGIVPPNIPRPKWIDSVSLVPIAIEVAKSANQSAKNAAVTAEAKANRLVQLGLAVLAFALALGAYQLTFALARSVTWLPTLMPVAIAIVCLAVSIFEAGEIDRVGFYGGIEAANFEGVAPSDAPAVELECEERGRALARWSANRKLSDLMQARAWLARGLIAFLAAALVAGLCRGLSTSPSVSLPAHQSPASTTTTAAPPS